MSWEHSKQMYLQYKAAKEMLTLDPTSEEARRLGYEAADWMDFPRDYTAKQLGVEAP